MGRSWERGGIIRRLYTQFVMGREGISVNNSDSLHNILAHRKVWCISCTKIDSHFCFCTQPSWVGTQEDHKFVFMIRDHTRLLLNLPALGTHLLSLPPFQTLGPFPTQYPKQLTCRASWQGLSVSVPFWPQDKWRHVFVNVWHLSNMMVVDCTTITQGDPVTRHAKGGQGALSCTSISKPQLWLPMHLCRWEKGCAELTISPAPQQQIHSKLKVS